MAAVLGAEVEGPRVSKLELDVVEMKSDIAHIRGDIADLKVDVRETRKDVGALKGEVSGLRDEMHLGFAAQAEKTLALREEMRVGFGNLQQEIMRRSLTDRIWLFSFAAGLLTLIARVFKWI